MENGIAGEGIGNRLSVLVSELFSEQKPKRSKRTSKMEADGRMRNILCDLVELRFNVMGQYRDIVAELTAKSEERATAA